MGEQDFLKELIELCPDGIIGVNREGIIVIFNRAAAKLTGYSPEEVIGKVSITEVYHPSDLAREIKKKIYSPDFGGVGRLEGFEVMVVTRDSKQVPIRLSATLLSENGTEKGSVGFFHDLTHQKDMEAKLRKLSVTDSLTGLLNQRNFHIFLEEEIARVRRYEEALSLICFDLDNFKQCNDKLGHLEGDNILRMLGELLPQLLRKIDRAFRYGGDEFMILLPETTLANAFLAAERIRKEFNARWPYGALFENAGLKKVTLSLGVAETQAEEDPKALIRRADMAMYEAKNSGGDRTVEAKPRIGR